VTQQVSPSFSHTLSVALSISLSRPHSLTLSLSHSLTLSLSHSLIFSLSHSLTLTLTLSLSHSLTLAPSLEQERGQPPAPATRRGPVHTHALTHSHTHTLAHSHTHTLAHSHTVGSLVPQPPTDPQRRFFFFLLYDSRAQMWVMQPSMSLKYEPGIPTPNQSARHIRTTRWTTTLSSKVNLPGRS